MQKNYTIDFLTKKKVLNKGIVPKYYIEDNHEAIIPKELFNRMQEEKARRTAIYRPATRKKDAPVKGKYSAKYILSDIMVCAECGQPYCRQVWTKYGIKKAVWRCDNRRLNIVHPFDAVCHQGSINYCIGMYYGRKIIRLYCVNGQVYIQATSIMGYSIC